MAEQNSLSESVDILNKQTGDLVTQYPQSADRVVNLTQSSIVRVNASPEVVNFYERQGSDLIVHMKDGSTVRYQNFFRLDLDGQHSELIFEDSLGTHHATFPFASEAAPGTAEVIVPTFADTDLGALVGGDGLLGAGGISGLGVLGGIAAVAGVVGIAAAASSGGGGGGGGGGDNGGGGGGGQNPNPPTSTLTINPFTGDNSLNKSESQQIQTLSGSAGTANAGSVVTFTLGGRTWTSTVGKDGSWSVNLPADVLQALPQGANTVKVTLIDSQGRTVTKDLTFNVDTIAPELEPSSFTPGGVLDGTQLTFDKVVRGISDTLDAGSKVTITLNGKTYTAVVGKDGSWMTTIPLNDMKALVDGREYTINYSISDKAGNVTTGKHTFDVNLTKPAITVDAFTGDNTLNAAESMIAQNISGHVQNVPVGTTVTVTLAGKTYLAMVQGDGSWKTTSPVPAADLEALVNGSYTISVSVPDGNGNTITASRPITVDKSDSSVAIAIISTDDYLNASEMNQDLEIRGSSVNLGSNAKVSVLFNGKTYTKVIIDPNSGYWSVMIPASDLVGLKDGPQQVKVTATQGGQNASDSHTLNVMVNFLPKPEVDAPFGDGIINAQERTVDQVVRGNTGVSGSGQKVSVVFGGKTYTATVDGEGNWSIKVPSADLLKLPEGNTPMVVNVTDAAGNKGTVTVTPKVDTLPPDLAVLPVTADGKLSAAELNSAQVLSGISSADEAGRTVRVVLNGKTYTTTVGSDGNWQVSIPSAALKLLPAGDNIAKVTLSDAAGNVREVDHTITVKTAQPTVSITRFTSDNVLDAAEVKTDQILQGNSTNAEAGSKVTVTLNGVSYTGIVGADGLWTVSIPAQALQQLANGETTLQLSITDAYGQTATGSHTVEVNTGGSGVAISIIADDNYLNRDEADSQLVIRGTSAGLDLGDLVIVTINGITHPAIIQADGTWQILLQPSELQNLPDGPIIVRAVASGNGGIVEDNHTLNVIIDNVPVLEVDPLFGDGVLNQAEGQQNQILTGKTGVTGAGQSVTITLGGNNYTGTVDSNGNWKVTIPSGALDDLTSADSPLPVTVVVKDVAGNEDSSVIDVIIDITPPTLSFDPFATNNALSLVESNSTQAFSGLATGAEIGSPVTVVLNGVTYNTTVTGANGAWSIDITSAQLKALPNGEVSFSVTASDAAGNSTSATHTIQVSTDPLKQPQLSVEPIAGNNIIDAAERGAALNITGTALNVGAGQTVTVTLGLESWTGTVGADGKWSVTIPQSALAGLTDGSYSLDVQVSDAAGNSASVNRPFSVDTTVSAISIAPLTGDDIIGVSDLAGNLTISGGSTSLAQGTVITVMLNGKQYEGLVGANGVWSVTVPRADGLAIADGTATVTASARATDGSVISTSHEFSVITHTLPVVKINPPFTDGIVNASEAQNGGTLSGSTGVNGAGQTVTVQLGGQTLNATVDANGNWSVNVPSSLLNGLSDGTVPMVVTATDRAGNGNELTSSLVIDKTPPSLLVNTIATDGIVNGSEAANPLVLTGTAGPYDPANPQYVVVTVNGQTYNALIQPNGTWSVTLPAGALSGMPDGPASLTVSVTDRAGNTTTQKQGFTLDASPENAPQININPVSTDNYVNGTEIGSNLTISGTTLNVEVGRPVQVVFNGVTYNTTVQAGGIWSISISPTALANVPDGPREIKVSVSDASGNVDDATQNVTFVAKPVNLPTLTVSTVAGDDVINAQEKGAALTINGTSTNLAPGTAIVVTLNNKTYPASVGADGKWSVQIPSGDVAALAEQGYTVQVNATDPAGNQAVGSLPITVDTLGPDIEINTSTGVLADSRINVSESSVAQIFNGTTAPNSTVVVTLNGKSYETLANDLGQWSVSIPAADLKAIPNSDTVPLQVRATDPQGNTGDETINIGVNNGALPTIAFNPVFTDNLINSDEAQAGGTITGTSVGLALNTVITLYIGTTEIGTATVQANGSWTANIDTNLLNQFQSGQYTITASAADGYQNPASGSANVEILLTAPVATLPTTLFGDNFINQTEAGTGQTLTGNTGLTGGGQTVQINIDGLPPILGTVDNNGNWTAQIPPDVLQSLADGEHTISVTVTDKAGNDTTSPDVTFDVRTDTLPEPTLTPPFDAGYLNADDAGGPTTIGGTTGLPRAEIGQVQVSINNGPLQNATINPDGTWSLDLPAGSLSSLPDGTIPVKVIVTDVANNTSTGNSSFEAIVNDLPDPSIGALFTDGILNNAEAGSDQVIRGVTGVTGEGQTVIVTYRGVPYTATVNADTGEWSVTLPSGAFTGLTNGTTQTVSVTATDVAGNSETVTKTFIPQTQLPTPDAPDLFGGDDVLNISEAAGPLTINGTTGVTGPNQFVTITIDVGGVTYTAQVNEAGTWSVALPAGALQGLDPNDPHAIIIRAEDQYGNVREVDVPFEVAFTAPTVSIAAPVFADGSINIDEAAGVTNLSGTFTSAVPNGTTITVTIGGKPFPAVVDTANGTWSLQLQPGDWAGVARGPQSVVVTIEDGADNTGSAIAPVDVALNQPTINVSTPFSDGVLDFSESQQLQTISGTTSGIEPGRTVSITLAGTAFTATVQPDGSWSFQVSPQWMAGLTNGLVTLVAEVTDKAGNDATTPVVDVDVSITPPTYSITMHSVTSDNVLNAAELGTGTVTISGATTGYTPGQQLNITINGTQVGVVTLNGDGGWTLNVPSTRFPSQGQYEVTATSVSAPVQSSTVEVTVDTIAPSVGIGVISGDDRISSTESNATLTLSGTASAVDIGRDVVVTLNGKTYHATVVTGGTWSVVVPQGDVAQLPSGNNIVRASMTDAAGNPSVVAGRTVVVDRDAPLLEVNTLSLPAVLNTVEAGTGLLVNGRGEPGNTVTVRIGPLSWTSTVDENGNWSHRFPEIDLTTLTDGAQVISISSTDAAGNTSSNSVALNVALNKGLGVLIDDVFGVDGIINVAESLITQALTGKVSGDYRGATVKVTVAGVDVGIPVGVVGPDGRFSIDLPPSIWQGLVGNTVRLEVDVTDANGNSTNDIIDVGLALTDLPVVGNILVGLDNAINLVESGLNQTVTGTLTNVANVTKVVITLAGRTYDATVDALGNWTATLPTGLLSTLPDGQIALGVNVTDKFGNVTSGSTNITIAANVQPSIVLSPLFGDGILSIPELLNGVISGTATGLNGRTITIKIGNTTAFTTNVDNTGKWSIALPEAVKTALEGLGAGSVAVTVTASDTYGNTTSAGTNITLDLLKPVLNAVTLFGDGLLNAADALLTQTITGSVGRAPLGSSVSVTVGGKTFAGVVAADGTFSINVNPSALSGLANGTLATSVTITTPDGNSSTSAGPTVKVGLTNLPTVAINSLFGDDGFLNQTEAGVTQTITGISSLTNGTVSLKIGAETLTGTITNGVWSVNVSSTILKGLADGTLTVTASVRDDVGNIGTGSKVVNTIINALPKVTIDTIFGDGNLNLADLLNPQVLSGTVTNLAAGTALTITLGGLTFNTTVASDGTWRLPVPTVSLQGLLDGTVAVGISAKDVAGNVASATQNLLVDIHKVPTLVINSLFGDNGLSVADLLSAQVISGTSTNAVGSLVNITLGGKSYQATVGANGGWSVSVPRGDLSALLDGTLTVGASLTNPAGTPASTSGLLNVITHNLPTISLTSLFGNDGFLNVAESNGTQTIGGRLTGGIADGAKVVVTLGGVNYNATVNPDGSWSLPVASNILKGLTSGALKVGVTVTDKVGNTNSTSADVTVKLTTPELSFNALASLNLITLLTKGLTLNGGSKNLAPNSVVHLSLLNGTVSTTAMTDANGNWSTTLNLGLNILELLSLTSVLTLYATDAAGNTGYLNVGLNGNIISTTPPAGATLAAASVDETAFSLQSAEEHNSSAEDSTSHTTAKVAATAAVAESETAAAQTADDAYTIGGVSITLADGQQLSGESVEGSTGGDTIHLSGLEFTHIDGGAGLDTLVLDGVNLTLDLIGMADKIQNIEIFDLGKSGTNSITLDVNGALSVTDRPEDDLIIKGSEGDRVNLVHGNGDIWAVSGQREFDGIQFDVWHNSGQNTTLGDVLIQHGLHVNMV